MPVVACVIPRTVTLLWCSNLCTEAFLHIRDTHPVAACCIRRQNDLSLKENCCHLTSTGASISWPLQTTVFLCSPIGRQEQRGVWQGHAAPGQVENPQGEDTHRQAGGTGHRSSTPLPGEGAAA